MAIPFIRHKLQNGLTLIIHQDLTTPLAACNIVYNVGSRDENPEQTGMAHLFEHFMFSGSIHIDNFDTELQRIGAVNNAYTSQDITHYYAILPANNLETLFWLESDRMLSLGFKQQQLDIQKHVVIEEFKETHLNRPFGDLWHRFYHQVYQKYPYRWLPIGEKIEHIESVSMDDVKDFFYRFYRPNNAVMVVSGNVVPEEVVALAEKWFGEIPAGEPIVKNYSAEDLQQTARFQLVEGNVPYELLVKGWLMCDRLNPDFYIYDLFADLLGNGHSSYLYRRFVAEESIFTSLSCHISAVSGPGTFVILGTPVAGISLEEADKKLSDYLYNFAFENNLAHNLQKVKNRVETILLNNEIKIEDRSSILAVSETISCIEDYEKEKEKYFAVSEENIRDMRTLLFDEEKSNTLYFRK
ncbi:insulinase family protein [Bacteroidales bacterium OttesenSCG-928-B11]|nr:insulinase family protein [Bacteroidales bacterium OttesenSCG-928-C03]MDL2312923.1 insulinase family protein [Bacteroidales bacterium OttesenSCG-928-B11]MDL2325535.1 insulinase family protein [Bacteroidales bacterium OttesenSCG-928-A14]